MRIAIVEDEKFWQSKIADEVKSFFRINIKIICFDFGEAFLKNPVFFEVVFMDVELGGADGFGISQEYKSNYPKCILIILTTHTEFCRKGYQLDAFRYLDKSHLEEMQEALEGVVKKLAWNKRVTFHVVSVGDMSILCKDIIYIETFGRNLALHTVRGIYECVGNISEVAEKLKPLGFYYIHRSYLVNIEEVLSFSRKEVILKNHEKLDMSVHRYADFKIFFLEWKMENGNG